MWSDSVCDLSREPSNGNVTFFWVLYYIHAIGDHLHHLTAFLLVTSSFETKLCLSFQPNTKITSSTSRRSPIWRSYLWETPVNPRNEAGVMWRRPHHHLILPTLIELPSRRALSWLENTINWTQNSPRWSFLDHLPLWRQFPAHKMAPPSCYQTPRRIQPNIVIYLKIRLLCHPRPRIDLSKRSHKSVSKPVHSLTS